ncbi:hypothetical protein CDN99_15530 [Roseateles aquatilis]|uniref:Uncharacterized protein n=1 Tax=Roseateles aquatilis TaxID=431061 RepID=A0A246J8M1_9BURK|nr:hypothetical protein [Roseateles aquatilis]MBY0365417.1 hypothetical protein [Burkholderiaceae bacterium]OWQ88883.1 hypothetical protein CDN99_15530 [Roseateles aquatilis]
MNYIELGPVPAEESCAQVGAPDYERNARRECGVFRRMLERLFPVPEDVDARFTVRQYPHDFGSYFEVCVAYGAPRGGFINTAPSDFAFRVESETPSHWDAIAQYELAWYERRDAYIAAVSDQRMTPGEVPAHYAAGTPPRLPVQAKFHELLAAYPL